MIYLDSAATTLQKPRAVAEAMTAAMRTMASPGRGGHRPAMLAAEKAYECREAVASLFGVSSAENVVFTMNATHALNIAINALVSPGDRVVISGWEHNAVTRPLAMLGAETDIVRTPLFDTRAVLEGFRHAVPGAKCVVCTHVSNVFGFVLPIYGIAEICREFGVPLIVDASQSAGALEVSMRRLGADFIAMPGHKGLLGPQGTGVLLCRYAPPPLMAGGTGSNSRSQAMPDFLPDRLEAGTHNIPGIAGLLEGVKYVLRRGTASIEEHERRLMRSLAKQLMSVPGLEVYLSGDEWAQAGVLSVRHEKIGSEELGAALAALGVCTRAGLHCAPVAHESAGTLETGTVRLSISPFNTAQEVKRIPSLMQKAIALAGE